MEIAACAGESVSKFFADADGLKGQKRRMANWEAKQICHRCPLMKPCLRYALQTNQVFGVWGGKTEAERAQLQQVRKLIFPGGR